MSIVLGLKKVAPPVVRYNRWKVKGGKVYERESWFKFDKILVDLVDEVAIRSMFRRKRWIFKLKIKKSKSGKYVKWIYNNKPPLYIFSNKICVKEDVKVNRNLTDSVYRVVSILNRCGLVENYRMYWWSDKREVK